jgi:Tol biopolymer transport system component
MIRALIAGAVLVVAAATLVVAGGGNSQPASQHSGQPASRHSVPPPDPLLAFTARAARGGTSQVFLLRADSSIRQLTHGVPSLTARDWSPDRSQLLVTDREGNGAAILTLDIATGILRTVWQHGGVVSAARWSADGSRIAFIWGGRLYSMPSDGSSVKELLPGHAGTTSLAWSDRGLGLAVATAVDHRPTVVLMRDGRPLRDLSTACRRSVGVECFQGTDPAWSPDGAVVFRCPSGHATGLCIVRRGVAGVDRVRLLGAEAQNPRLPAWSPVTESLAFVASGGLFVAPDRSGRPRLATTLAATSAPSWSANGENIAAAVRGPGGWSVLAVAQRDGWGVTTFSSPSPALPEIVGPPVWRPR